jgi:hypothetical protein
MWKEAQGNCLRRSYFGEMDTLRGANDVVASYEANFMRVGVSSYNLPIGRSGYLANPMIA